MGKNEVQHEILIGNVQMELTDRIEKAVDW